MTVGLSSTISGRSRRIPGEKHTLSIIQSFCGAQYGPGPHWCIPVGRCRPPTLPNPSVSMVHREPVSAGRDQNQNTKPPVRRRLRRTQEEP